MANEPKEIKAKEEPTAPKSDSVDEPKKKPEDDPTGISKEKIILDKLLNYVFKGKSNEEKEKILSQILASDEIVKVS